MIRKILNSKTRTFTFAAFLLAFSTLLSRLLGLLRDRLLAGKFGAGEELDIYFAAFRIPDFVYGVLVMGGITAAFLPVFSNYIRKESEGRWPESALDFANNVLNCFLILLVIICVVLAILAPWLIRIIIPGFSEESSQLTADLTRIMFLSPILFGLSNIFSGILHYFNKFLVYSLAPILYNLGIIIGILFFFPVFGIYGLAYGVILGAGLHLFVQVPAAVSSGYKYRRIFNFNYPGLKRVFRLMVPRSIGTAAYHINLIVITAIASTLAAGSIAIFTLANNLHYFPIGIIGISFALSVFPSLSRAWAEQRREDFLKELSSSLRQILFFIIPTAVLIFIFRAQLVRLVLGTGEFGWLETRLTAASLGVFSIGILGNSLIPLLSRSFFALHDTKTPVVIGLFAMGLNIFSFSFIFLFNSWEGLRGAASFLLKLGGIEDISIIALPLALSLAVLVQAFLLILFLYKKLGEIKGRELRDSLNKIIVSSVLLALTAFFVRGVVSGFVNMQTFWGVFLQTLTAGALASAVFLGASLVLKSPEIGIIKDALSKQFRK